MNNWIKSFRQTTEIAENTLEFAVANSASNNDFLWMALNSTVDKVLANGLICIWFSVSFSGVLPSIDIAWWAYAANGANPSGFATAPNCILLGQWKSFSYSTRVQVPTLSIALQEFNAYIGLNDNHVVGDAVNGVYFRYNRLLNGNFRTCVSAAWWILTTVVTTIPIVAAQRYVLEIFVTKTGSAVTYKIDGVTVATIVINIPIASTQQTGIMFAKRDIAGINNHFIYVDNLYYQFTA